MSCIMCTQKLWRALGETGQPPVDPTEPIGQPTILGSWALKSFHYNRKGLVLALEERSYLTLVFPLAPRDGFRARFAVALRQGLLDIGVAPLRVEREVIAIDFLPFARLTHGRIGGSLNNLVFLARCELDYISDLRRVQWNLNDVPHVRRDPCVPKDAVAQLFNGSAAPVGDYQVH